MRNLSLPHEAVDARTPESKPVLMEGAAAGHVLVKNTRATLPFRGKLKMLSVFGYDAAPPPTKNIDALFQLGYTSSPDMAQAVLGSQQRFDQAARGGVIVTGGRAGANAPPYMSDVGAPPPPRAGTPRPARWSLALLADGDAPARRRRAQPLSALQQRAAADGTWLNWDVAASATPDVNGATQACLVFINAMATEGWDRSGLRDEASDALVVHVADRCARTVVVVHAAGARLVDGWIDHANVTAVVMAHLPGQDAGAALVRLLYGDGGADFSGRLPYTLARREADYPVYEPCGRGADQTTNPQCEYSEGVYVDYRAFDARNVTPRFEFGFGLSYTEFAYTSLAVWPDAALRAGSGRAAAGGGGGGGGGAGGGGGGGRGGAAGGGGAGGLWDVVARVEATVGNSGSAAGHEVAQLYVGIPGGPPKQLRGFEKLRLRPGQRQRVRFALTRRDLSAWDVVRQRWAVPSGTFDVYVGASSRDVRLTASLVVDGQGCRVA